MFSALLLRSKYNLTKSSLESNLVASQVVLCNGDVVRYTQWCYSNFTTKLKGNTIYSNRNITKAIEKRSKISENIITKREKTTTISRMIKTAVAETISLKLATCSFEPKVQTELHHWSYSPTWSMTVS